MQAAVADGMRVFKPGNNALAYYYYYYYYCLIISLAEASGPVRSGAFCT